MKLLVRAIVTGFGLAIGAAFFKKHVAPRIGLQEDDKKAGLDPLTADGATDPNLRERFH
jgi:hypothetical protein